ncbi:MAG: phosphoglucomutase [Bacteroidetes bacterium GWC2_33_15]|nr:MAG: phosphoglucomutase [Bacteroidetes bacterium GWA2_33_15]OFX49402.1 MAG: phosphoglucomutase [Bacteroidetes bacterium GWC2_33_15]OFX63005.1 MAG: phosphoglucomutase [Bacteroidetes bacterium GWB2_32_14]OFX68750.1 MAG: phosphoglucomutase [Bacteroidetes bacterium GWD2_33_33]HAN19075.1 phosphomannomutase/phosphoglucomutase [Bacteroidales bacterium]
MKAFKAYDIRGIYNEEFTKDDAYKIGYFLPELLQADNVLVGRDVRVSSDEIFEALARGIIDSGANVYNIGLATTPMVYYMTAKHKFSASVQITASHNSREYNGMKISRANALPVGLDTGLNRLLEMIQTREIEIADKRGKIIDYKVKDEYVQFLKTYIQDYSNIKMAIDCSNGMAALLIKKLLGKDPIYIFDDMDGTFPNHEPNPLIEENVADLKKVVLDQKCDIGVIFDGDADRVMFVDEKGKFISPDLIIGFMAHYFLEKEKGNVLEDIRTSKAVKEYVENMGCKMHTWRVGRAFASPKLKEINGIYGGELAGHYYFRDFFYSDSGILASLIVLNLLSRFKKEGKSMSEIISNIAKYANSGELNFKIEKKQEAMDALKDYFVAEEEPMEILDFDGYRIEFKDWWFNVRPSNTEPYLRLLAEADNEKILKEKIDEIKTILKKFK